MPRVHGTGDDGSGRGSTAAAPRSTWARLRPAAAALVVCAAAMVGCADDGADEPGADRTTEGQVDTSTNVDSSPAAADGSWTVPGLADEAGRPFEVVVPEPGEGRRLDVTDFGADPEAGAGDDAGPIRDALDDAGPGDVVVVPEGVYELRSTHPDAPSANLVVPSGVQLRGAGMDRTELVTDFDGDDDSVVILAEGVDDVVVSGLTVTSTYDGPLGTDPDDDEAGGGPMFGILIGERDGRGSARVLVEDVRVERFQRHGISLKATREVVVRGCSIADATGVGAGGQGYGIAVEGRAAQRDPGAPTDSRHNVVVDNVLDGRHLRHAILLQFPTHNNLIAGNLVTGSVLDAIDLHGEGEYLNEIRDNTVVGGQRAAIALGNSGGGTHAHAASGEGNWVHRNDLVDNQVGVLVILGTPGTVIEANRIVTSGDGEAGIRIDDGPGTIARRNVVVTSGDADAVDVDDPDDVELVRNRVDEPTGPDS